MSHKFDGKPGSSCNQCGKPRSDETHLTLLERDNIRAEFQQKQSEKFTLHNLHGMLSREPLTPPLLNHIRSLLLELDQIEKMNGFRDSNIDLIESRIYLNAFRIDIFLKTGD